MSRDSALSGGAPTPKLGPAVWLWPAAAALLAAWPVWRSMFPEFSDVGEGWLRLQPILGGALALLYLVWAMKWRRRFYGVPVTEFAVAIAAGLLITAARRGDAAGADLTALIIAWIAAPGIFAALVLLQVQKDGVDAGCRPPQQIGLLPPIPGLGAIILGVSVAVLAGIVILSPPPTVAVIMGVVSPGLILAWSSLSDTARSVLSKRQVHVADASNLQWLARRRRWLLRVPTILVSDRVKLVSLYPAADIKPGELVGLAAAATMDEESDIGRAIQEFGVSHRIRLPALRQSSDGQPASPRRAMLAHGVIVELCAPDESLDLTAHAEAIELARAQHREVLVLVERAPDPRLLGVLVFAVGARAGAQEALRLLRDRRVTVALTAQPRDAADELALKSLRVAGGADGAVGNDATIILRGTQSTETPGALVVSFGTRHANGAAQIVVAREDARALVDLARFADDFRTRTRIVTLLASAPGWVLIAAALGYVPATPFLVTGVAVIGIIIATAAPQVLRLSPVLDNEGTED